MARLEAQTATPPRGEIKRTEIERAAEEFKVLSRDMGLRGDSRRRAGAAPSRRAQFHGRLFENLRNDFLDAVPHEIAQRGGTKNLLRRNQFGFNLSGPVTIPKLYPTGRNTFFSISYEGLRERIGRSYLRTVPILPERDGDYRLVVDPAGEPLRIYDPASNRLNPGFDPSQPVSESNLQNVRDIFPQSIIPLSRQDPVTRRILNYYPTPNADAGPFFRNNYFIVAPETNTADGMIAKVDHTFLEKHQLAGTLSFTNGTAGTARYIPNAADSAVPDRIYENRRVSLEHTFTASPQSVNTATFELYRDNSKNSSDPGDFDAELGLKGVNADVFPVFRPGSYLAMGRANPVSRTARNTWVFTNSHSLKRNKHNLRFVLQFVRTQVNTFVPQFPSGFFQFRSYLTSLPGIVNTGHGFASMLLGLSDYTEVSLVPSPSYFRNSRSAFIVQDTWELRPDLTLSGGINFEYATPRSERYDRQSTIDLSVLNPENGRPGALIFAGQNSQGRSFMPNVLKPQPNVSVAWNPRGNRKSVLRASYSINYTPAPIYNSQWGTQGFNGYSTFFSQNIQLYPAITLRDGVPPPSRPLPDLRGDAANFTGPDLVERSGRQPFYQSAGLSYERELPGSFTVTGSLGLSWGRDLFVGSATVNPNAIHPDQLVYRDKLNDESFRRLLRPYPQYLNFEPSSLWPAGRYRREAASLRIEKRTSTGLSLTAFYEYSRQYDDYSGPYGRQDFFNSRNEWSLTAYNNPHRLSLSYMYELPIGVNKPFLNFGDWRRHLTGGWSLSGISSVASGEPLALRAQFNNTGTVLETVRVNVVDGVDPNVANQGPDLWFNPAAFSHPSDFSLGNGPRTHPTLRNPTTQNHDLSVSKRFAIDQERAIELNASGFNFINLGVWNDPDVFIGTESAPNANAGKIIGSRGGRVIQVGLRFSF
jgi:hypothetical protein